MFFAFYYFTLIVFLIPSLFFQTLLVSSIIFIFLISLNLYTKKLKKKITVYGYSIKLGLRKKAEKERTKQVFNSFGISEEENKGGKNNYEKER
jgi:hypothetical protein